MNQKTTLGFLDCTFRVETRSAVSSNVNCPIWSTILEIFGLDDAAAASVLCHLRDSCVLR